jgi:hypothetical protein
MQWFGCLLAAKKNKDQTTSGHGQNTANQNQFRRHEEFLSQNPRISLAVLPTSLTTTKGR